MKMTVVGLGLIGGSLALDLKASGFVSEVTGVDSRPEHGKQALELGFVSAVKPLPEAVAHADLVVLAIPVHAIAKILPEVMDLIGAKTTVTDMGSTKELICKSVAGHAKRAQFVASHPMAGTEFSGPQAAVRGLFEKRAAVICDRDQSGKEHLGRIEEMYQVLKMRTIFMTSVEHDLHAAYVSHLSHISSFVLANAVLDKERDTNAIFDLASGGFESTVRLAKSSADMWTPIFEQNRGNVVQALDAYIEHLQKFKKSIVDGRFDETRGLMENANKIRRVLNRISK